MAKRKTKRKTKRPFQFGTTSRRKKKSSGSGISLSTLLLFGVGYMIFKPKDESIGSSAISKKRPPRYFKIYDSFRNKEQVDNNTQQYKDEGIQVYVHDNGNAEGELKYDLYLDSRSPNARYYV